MTGPGDTKISLREYLEQRLDAMEKALLLQSQEYSRRLDALHHAHEAAVLVQHTYVPRETYELFVKEYRGAHELIKDLFIKSSSDLLLMKEQLVNKESFQEKMEVLEKWQTQQEAIFNERERSSNKKLVFITFCVTVLNLVLKFIKF